MNESSQLPRLNKGDDDEISLLDLLTDLGQEKATLLTITVAGTVIAIITALLIPRMYTASTLLLPPQQQQSAAVGGALAQLGALAGVAGASTGLKTTDETYLAFLQTRRLQDALIQRFQLQKRYEAESLETARIALDSFVNAKSDKKSGLITVSATDTDPKFAAELANAHVDELRKLLSEFAVTEAQQRRVFFEQQVNKTTQLLASAEIAFRKEQEFSGMVVSQALAEGTIRAGIELRSRIAEREVQLLALSQFATDKNPDTLRLTAELSALKQQLKAIEYGTGGEPKSDFQGMAAVKAYRNLKTREAALEALIRQYELAKLDESREGPLLQQVDVAVPPEFPSRPQRTLIVVAGALVSLMLAALVALVKVSSRNNSEIGTGWLRLKKAWLGR